MGLRAALGNGNGAAANRQVVHQVNTEQLRLIMPHAPALWLEALKEETERLINLDDPHEQASFIAQLAHESVELTRVEENLNYSAQRLMQVWPRTFKTIDIARQYERNPQKLANFIYAYRIGNGAIESGDGWRYRGRGPIQITGRNNYTLCGDWLGLDLLKFPDLLLEPKHGIGSACWYWVYKDLDRYDDDDDVRAETKIINGGEIGLAQRQLYFNKAISILREAA
jgi:putative chitinase